MRIYVIPCLFLLLCSCRAKSKPSLADQQKAMRLFKEATDTMMKGLGIELANIPKESSLAYYREAIDLFHTALRLDPTPEYGLYLDDLYFGIRKYDSAIYWKRLNIPIDSVAFRKNNNQGLPQMLSTANIFIGNCHMYTGNLDSANIYFKKAIKFGTKHMGTIALSIFQYGKELAYTPLTGKTGSLPKHIDRCHYAVKVIELAKVLAEAEKTQPYFYFPTDSIKAMKKNCR